MTQLSQDLAAQAGISAALARDIQEVGNVIQADPDTSLFQPGDPCENFLMVLDGSVRVEHMNEAGRAMVLYRLGAGECCTITTSNLLSEQTYDVSGFAEVSLTALAISRARFESLMDSTPEFRRLAFAAVSRRMGDFVRVIDDLLVRRTDLRLIEWLLNTSGPDGQIQVTHQRIADEIGTAREVVSRLLKEFERRGWLSLSRGVVRVLQRDALARTSLDRDL